MTMGAVIEYLDSPVDGYREVLAAAAFRRGLRMLFHCPFIAVDSLASLAAGRKNWSLPKVLVAVDGQPGHSGTTTCRSKSEAPWTVTASARALSPALPMAKNFLLWQEFPSGGLHEIPARLSGRVRLALIDIDVESSHRLERLVRPGRHLGLLADTMSATLGVPRPVPIERR
ncbi:hypothetical protein [Nocardia tenerifensis]|nr:hypothetical protein [Nocardia tenerifensis]